MPSGQELFAADFATRPLPARALVREADRARQLLAAGKWRPTRADADAAAHILARLTAPLPARGDGSARTRATDRDRRLQRTWRTTVHHLDAGAVSAPAAALVAAVARALLPWHTVPSPPPAAAAARYPLPQDTFGGPAPTPTEAGEALLPGLARLFTALATPTPPETAALTPPAVPWEVRHTGRFRHYARPAPGVWTADTFRCPGCGHAGGPWTVSGDWRLITLGCACGLATGEHGLTFSEIWLCLPDS
ncbi:hypothetical protein ACFV0T_25575 [Streptomyces sp. NPDC059582]|uniref:hypothetical protein n=1 Tax=Streptomyces sp. NPDC059582 TaxID=3346875 RepID=UPI00367F17FD